VSTLDVSKRHSPASRNGCGGLEYRQPSRGREPESEQAFEPIEGVTAEGTIWWEPDLAGDFVLDEYVRDSGQFPDLWVYACGSSCVAFDCRLPG